MADVKTQALQATLSLPPGRYLWGIDLMGFPIKSGRRSLEVLGADATRTGQTRLGILWHLIDSGRDATLALDTGL